jgi:hypothetical protein
MSPYKDNYDLLEAGIRELIGSVIHESEYFAISNAISYLRAPVLQENINDHLQTLAGIRATLGFFYQRAKKMAAQEKSRLDSIYARLYNGERNANSGRGPKPTAESLKNSVLLKPEHLQAQESLICYEYYRNLLKEVRDALTDRKSQLEQIANNIRFEGRIDQE